MATKEQQKTAQTDGKKTNGKVEAPQILTLPEIRLREARITLEGITPLICHRFSEKARKQMLDKQMKRATPAREAKNPEELFRSSLYVVPGMEGEPDGTEGKYYFPVMGFKRSAVEACRFLGKEIAMTQARGLFFIVADPATLGAEQGGAILRFEELNMREDYVRNETRVADLRYRGQFTNWEVTLQIEWNEAVCTLEQIVNLFHHAGFHCGVGEWRPSAPKGLAGDSGRFRVSAVDA